MNKIASFICVALVAVSAVLPVSAAGKENWTAGNGFLISDKNSPVTITEAADGVQLSWGGYYTNGINWGGAVYNEKVDLEGFTAEVRVDKLPDADTKSDTWISLDFMANPQLFMVGDKYADNPGIANLIRYADAAPYVASYGPKKWVSIANDKNAKFAVKAGDTLKVSVVNKNGKYVLTINGIELTSQYDLSTIAPDGKAYFVISASMKDSQQDAFKFTVTKLNGKPTVTTAAAAATTTKTPTAAAQTSDASAAVAAVCFASLAGAAVVIKKKHRV